MQKQYEEQKRELEEKSARQLEIKEQNKRINEEIKRNKELERENEIFESLKVGNVVLVNFLFCTLILIYSNLC